MKAVVDRFEGSDAVVLIGDTEIQLGIPLQLLPPGVREGSFLDISITLDNQGEAVQREKIQGLLDKLKNRPKKT